MESKCSLQEIPHSEWAALRDLFTPNWPEHILGYSIVDNFINWRVKNGNKDIRNIRFLSLNGDWKSDGTFLAIVSLFIYLLNSYSYFQLSFRWD